MTARARLRLVCVCSALFVALLFDTANLVRITLCMSALHEVGHVVAYIICMHHLPKLTLRFGGVALQAQALPCKQEAIVLCAGSSMNFLFALAMLWVAQYYVRLVYYFIACVSLCIGFFNLLPIGTLDGARLLLCTIKAEYVPFFEQLQRIVTVLFCVCGCVFALTAQMPMQMSIALIICSAYLLWQGLFSR